MTRHRGARYTLDGDDVDLGTIIEVNAHRLTPEVIERLLALKPGESVVLFDALADFPLRRVE
jgi:hypothetical protein